MAETTQGRGGTRRRGASRRHSIRDVAATAGVSVGTVSNVLNNPGRVAAATRGRVAAAIEELHFVRSAAAHQLRAGISRAVGAIVLDVGNPFFTEVIRGVEDVLAEADRILITCSSDSDPVRERRYLRMLEEQGVSGVLITPSGRDLTQVERIRAGGIPTVLLGRRAPAGSAVCSVAADDVKGGELAGAHLLALGHRRIALVSASARSWECADRRRGVRRAIRAAGRSADQDILDVGVDTLTSRHGERAVETILAARPRPTAVICLNDLAAIGVLRGLKRAGLRTPTDMAVVGYDDVEFAGMLSTPLTSVRQPKYELGQVAARLLLADRGQTWSGKRNVLFAPELIVRDSSGGPVSPRPRQPKRHLALQS